MIPILQKLNKILEKLMPLVAPSGVVLGLLFTDGLRPLTFLVPWIFGMMTFAGSLGSNFKDLRKVVLNPLPLLTCLAVIHIVMPLLALLTGHLIFPGDVMTLTGLVLLFVIPTGIVSVVWVTMCRGNLALTLSLILIDTFLSPFIVPLSMSLFVGAKVEMDVLGIMRDLTLMVVLPSLIGMACNQWTGGRVKETWGKNLSPFSKIGLLIVIAINSAAIASNVKRLDATILLLIVVTLFLAVLGYVVGLLVAKLLRWDHGIMVAMTINSGMRNLSAGMTLAVLYFPPAVALPVIIGSLFQQTLGALASFVIGKLEKGRGAGEAGSSEENARGTLA